MKGLKFLQGAAVALAMLGVVAPSPNLFAADQAKPTATNKAVKKAQIPDVSLAAGGVLSGRVVDHTGSPIEGAEVVIKQNGKTLKRTVTDEKGLFSSQDLKGGVYQVASGNTDVAFRLWSEQTAPPVAKGQALLVMGENGARGQGAAVDPLLIVEGAALISLLTLAIINNNKINQLQNQIDKLTKSK